jgi:DNA polymerase-4
MRSVLFIDPPAFCTTLEGLVAPQLRTRPLAVAPPGADRAAILALSAEARSAGLQRGMSVRSAQRLCPDLIVLPPNLKLYARASRALHQILQIFAPAIEPRGYGHAFLDLTGTDRLFGPPQDVAMRIRRETGGQTDDELMYVPVGNERSFLAPHPLDVLPDLDAGMRARLDDYQLDVIGEVAAISESALCAVFGRGGRTLRARARGIDPRPVLPPERQSEFHVAHVLSTDTNDLGVLHPILRCMTERLGRRVRARGLTASRLRLELTYADYTTAARAVSLSVAVLDSELWAAAKSAFELANNKRLAVRSVALTLSGLMEPEAQLELWTGGPTAPPPRCPAVLQEALDSIHSRYGSRGIIRGHQATTIFPKVALPSRTRCASAS